MEWNEILGFNMVVVGELCKGRNLKGEKGKKVSYEGIKN